MQPEPQASESSACHPPSPIKLRGHVVVERLLSCRGEIQHPMHVVFLKTQSTATASQNAFHSAQAFHGGVGTVVLSRFPMTLIAPPIQMICSIFLPRSGDALSRFMIGVKGHVTSSVT